MNVFPIMLILVKINNTKVIVFSICKCRIEIKKWKRRNLQKLGWIFIKPNTYHFKIKACGEKSVSYCFTTCYQVDTEREALGLHFHFHRDRWQAQKNITGKIPETSVISDQFWKNIYSFWPTNNLLYFSYLLLIY